MRGAKRRRRTSSASNESNDDSFEAGEIVEQHGHRPGHPDGDAEDDEEEGELRDERHRLSREHHKSKAKKHKRDKKKRKKRYRSPDRAAAATSDTDKEGGLTPPPQSRKQQNEAMAAEETAAKARPRPDKRKRSVQPDAQPFVPPANSGGVISLSVEETNKLRAQLGLKPLSSSSDGAAPAAPGGNEEEGTLIPNSNVRHKPAENLTQKLQVEKVRDKLAQRRQKRLQEAKLLATKGLGQSDSEDDVDTASNWVHRQKQKEKDKLEAQRRAKALEDLDAEFGVAALVEDDRKKSSVQKYGSHDLHGLKVQHSADRFNQGSSIILTLMDSDVLDDKAQDTLVNVNLMDEEKVEKNLRNRRDAKLGGYNPYENEELDPVTGDLSRKALLSKYDEEIEGEKKDHFQLGSGGQFDQEEELRLERMRIRQKLSSHKLESLELPALTLASDYLSQNDCVKFKKVKKKKVKRKILKADDLLAMDKTTPDPADKSEASVKADDLAADEVMDDAEFSLPVIEEDDSDLQKALARARKLKQSKRVEDPGAMIVETLTTTGLSGNEDLASNGAELIATFADDASQRQIVLNETSEFCRHLGAWRSSEVTGAAETVAKDILDFESSLQSSRRHGKGGWEEISHGHDSSGQAGAGDVAAGDEVSSSAHKQQTSAILDEEPDLSKGLMAAIHVANAKGHWETKATERKGSNLQHLQARHYTIEDKVKDDERSSRRGGGADRYNSGPTQPFAEKSSYTPNVQLEYIDDNNRMLTAKEAFRYLSHKFHGKGSGKLKTEKRMKKVMEDSLMKNMSSTDTPLQTLERLREKQKQSATPYVVLTGSKLKDPTDLRK